MGTAPALFFEVKVADSPTMYPADETPVPEPGMTFVKVRISGKANYSDTVRPFLDFHGAIAAGQRVAGAFVSDPRAFANVIRGMPQADNPKDKGHFHEVSAEFWFILEGTINYKIGDLPIFDAVAGRRRVRPEADVAPRPPWRYRLLDASGHERLPAAAA